MNSKTSAMLKLVHDADATPDPTSKEVREIRSKLVENGHQPIALSVGHDNLESDDYDPALRLKHGELLGSKMPFHKDWMEAPFEYGAPEKLFPMWSSQGGTFCGERVPSRTTGIRKPTAIDLDIDDKLAIETVLDAIQAEFGNEWFDAAPIRTGGGEKLCIICQGDGETKPGKTVSPRWLSPDGEVSGQVEVFHGKGQVGVHGVHSYRVTISEQGSSFFTPKPTFEPAIFYDYLEGPKPFDTPLDQLPVLDRDMIETVVEIVDETLEGLGWKRLETEPGGDGGTSYTLDTDLVFDTEHGLRTYDELEDDVRMSMAAITGDETNTTKSKGRTFVTRDQINGQYWVGVHDFETDTNYLPPGCAPLSAAERRAKVKAMGDKLAEDTQPDRQTLKTASYDTVVSNKREIVMIDDGAHDLESDEAKLKRWAENLVCRYVLFPAGKHDQRVVDLATGVPMSKDGFTDEYACYRVTLDVEKPGGGGTTKKTFAATDAWKVHPDLVKISGHTFKPGVHEGLIPSEDGGRGAKPGVNVWKPPLFSVPVTKQDVVRAAQLFDTFLAHLVPDEASRAFLKNWIACKVQNPGDRGVAVALVGATEGTGKSILGKIMTEMMGETFTAALAPEDIMGSSAASSYGAGMERKVLAIVNEMKLTKKQWALHGNSVKTFIDTTPQRVGFNPKGETPYTDWAYHSVLMFSNEEDDALAVHHGARRFAVLRVCTDMLEHMPDAKAAADELVPTNPVKGTDGYCPKKRMMHALYIHLKDMRVDKELFCSVPRTEAFDRLARGGAGGVEQALADVLDRLEPSRRAILVDDLVDAAVRLSPWLGHSDRNRVSSVTRGLLSKPRAGVPGGGSMIGFEGWWMNPDKVFVQLPPDAEVPDFVNSPKGRPYVRGLAVREKYAEGALTPRERGELVLEVGEQRRSGGPIGESS